MRILRDLPKGGEQEKKCKFAATIVACEQLNEFTADVRVKARDRMSQITYFRRQYIKKCITIIMHNPSALQY